MIVLPDFSSVFCAGEVCVRYSYFLYLIIPAIIFLVWIIRKTFVKLMSKDEQYHYEKERKKIRIIIMITRISMFILLLIAISSPYMMSSSLVKGNPRLTILTDDSNSFDLFDKGAGQEIYEKIKGKVPADLRTIGLEETSAIGNGILNNLEGGENILVISDGSNNKGKLLGDVILFASSINSTISTISLEPKNNDVGVTITGPYEVIKDTDGNFLVEVNNVGKDMSYTLEVTLDNEVVYSKQLKGSQAVPLSKTFSSGAFHKLTAELKNINMKDHFSENNRFFKTIKVVNRPSILFVSEKSSPLQNEFDRLYDVTKVSSIPDNLDNYMAVVLNDLHANDILPKLDIIRDYVADNGNGLVVIGGQNSYDRGSYRQAKLIEPILPVTIGSGEESEKSDTQVVVVIDVSGTTTEVINQDGVVEVRDFDKVIKALAVSVLDNLDDKHNVGVVVVGTPTRPFVGKVSDIITLKDNKEELIDKISRLQGGGQSFIEEGIKQATSMLMEKGGGKNIILISDGRGLADSPKLDTKDAVRQANARAIKTYVVGVGSKDKQETDFLSDIATIGGGIYFPADAGKRLKILFGEPDEDEEEYFNSLSIIDSVHFITTGLETDAVISGYNYVVPKSAARLLVATNKNIPIIAVWRFGLGRIVSIATDDGARWAGEMLTQKNSKLVTRSVNWAIGNLGRKKDFDVSIRDTTLNSPTYVEVISRNIPEHDKLFFAKTDVNTFRAEFTAQDTGFYNFLGADVAVNYNIEYQDLGIKKDFINVINATGGTVFDKDDIDSIIDFVIEKSRRVKMQSKSIAWPFILLIIIIFLLEIFLRRMWENKTLR